MQVSSLSRCIHLTARSCDCVSISPCIRFIKMQQLSLLFDITVMMFYIKRSCILIPNLLYPCSLFSFWVNPLSLYCCKHLANEPILRQWPLPPIKALKPTEDLLGQGTREKERDGDRYLDNKPERMIEVIQSGLCALRNIYSRF